MTVIFCWVVGDVCVMTSFRKPVLFTDDDAEKEEKGGLKGAADGAAEGMQRGER